MDIDAITVQAEETIKKMMADAHKAKDEHIALMWCHMAEGAKNLWWDLCDLIIKGNKDIHKRIELNGKIDVIRLQFDEILEISKVPTLKKYE